MRHNSTIFKNPQDQHLFDLSSIGSINHEDKSITINQEEHYFKVGEVLYYDVTTNKFSRAVAVNNIESEACGIVSEVIDNDNFIIIAKGLLETDKYNFSVGSKLYLSDVTPGKLVSIEPQSIIKQIAIQATNGIIIDIQRGWKITNTSSSEELEPYTKEELDEIIKNVW